MSRYHDDEESRFLSITLLQDDPVNVVNGNPKGPHILAAFHLEGLAHFKKEDFGEIDEHTGDRVRWKEWRMQKLAVDHGLDSAKSVYVLKNGETILETHEIPAETRDGLADEDAARVEASQKRIYDFEQAHHLKSDYQSLVAEALLDEEFEMPRMAQMPPMPKIPSLQAKPVVMPPECAIDRTR